MMPRNLPQSRLDLSCRLSVFLGATQEEICQPQTVWLELTIQFAELPAACQSDALVDAVDYGELWRELQTAVNTKSYQLLEHLGYQLYHKLKDWLPKQASLVLRVTKTPPAASIDRASFVIDDTVVRE